QRELVREHRAIDVALDSSDPHFAGKIDAHADERPGRDQPTDHVFLLARKPLVGFVARLFTAGFTLGFVFVGFALVLARLALVVFEIARARIAFDETVEPKTLP